MTTTGDDSPGWDTPSAGNAWDRVARIATVRTIRRWHRQFVTPSPTPAIKTGGKADIPVETTALIVKLAAENDHGNDAWGRRRIAGELEKLGIEVSSSTVRRVLRRHGIPPAPSGDVDVTRMSRWPGPLRRRWITTWRWTLPKPSS